MKTVKKLLALVLASALALTLLTGCGGGGGGNSTDIVVDGRPMSLSKSRVTSFENAFDNEMKEYGYVGVTYDSATTDFLYKTLKEAAKNQATDSYAIAGVAYVSNPDWNDVAEEAAYQLAKWAAENGVNYANQKYGYVRLTDKKTGAEAICVLVFGRSTNAVV